MTDLLSPLSQRRDPATSETGRPLAISAALAGAAAPLSVLLVTWAVALAGWFASEGGSHGTTRSALRIGADAWLLAHGATLTVDGTVLTAAPLGLTLLCAVVTFRLGRRAAETSAAGDLHAVGLGTVVLAGVYGVVTVLTAVLASVPGAQPGLGRAFLGGVAVGAVAGGAGLLTGSGRGQQARDRIPVPLRSAAYGAVVLVLTLLGLGSVLVAVALGVQGPAAANVLSGLHADTAGGLLSLLVLALITPNVMLLGSAYLLGPGFAVGTGTVVSPAEVLLGPVPAVPVFAALPQSGPGPVWAGAVYALPVLVAGAAAFIAARAYPTRSWQTAAARGLGAGVLGAVVLTVLIGFAGGAIGPGRMQDLGAPLGEVLLVGLGALGLGGLLGGLVAVWWRRRTVPEDAEEGDREAGPDDVTRPVDQATEPTVVIPRRPTE